MGTDASCASAHSAVGAPMSALASASARRTSIFDESNVCIASVAAPIAATSEACTASAAAILAAKDACSSWCAASNICSPFAIAASTMPCIHSGVGLSMLCSDSCSVVVKPSLSGRAHVTRYEIMIDPARTSMTNTLEGAPNPWSINASARTSSNAA